MQLDPNFSDLHAHYGLCLAYLGRFDEAITSQERALQLDPFFPGNNIHHGTILFFSRDYDRAAAQFAKTLELYPDNATAHEYFGDVYAQKGDAREAITHWCAALDLSGRTEDARLIERVFATAGFDAAVRTLAERELEALDRRRAQGRYVAAAHYVFAHVRRGNLEQAFALLPKMAEAPDWFALQMRVNPILDPLRADSRFDQIATCLTPQSAK
jgi:tetratricopeptide (TPR) repeat protein